MDKECHARWSATLVAQFTSSHDILTRCRYEEDEVVDPRRIRANEQMDSNRQTYISYEPSMCCSSTSACGALRSLSFFPFQISSLLSFTHTSCTDLPIHSSVRLGWVHFIFLVEVIVSLRSRNTPVTQGGSIQLIVANHRHHHCFRRTANFHFKDNYGIDFNTTLEMRMN